MAKRTINVPTSWADVSLGQFIDYLEAMDEENFTQRHAKTVAAFTEMSYDECMKAIPWQDLLKVSGMIAEFLGQLEEPRLVHFVTLDGVEYGFHPQIGNMTAGEYIDLTNLDRGFWLDADKAMAILYRPVSIKIGNKYQVEDYGDHHIENADVMRQLPMNVVQGAAAFFLTLARALAETLTTYSEAQMETMEELVSEAIQVAQQAGINTSTIPEVEAWKRLTT